MRRVRTLAVLLLLVVAAAESRANDLATVAHDGRAYVSLEQIASRLGTRLDATPSSIRAYLRIPGHVVTLTRNWSHVVVDGESLVLDAPVRVGAGTWLVPVEFLQRVVPRLGGVRLAATPASAPAPVPAQPAAAASKPALVEPQPALVQPQPALVQPQPALVQPQPLPAASTSGRGAPAVTLEELRFRSYPSFTRIVIETAKPITHRLERTVARETRVRVPALAAEPRVEEIKDGLIDTIRMERAGNDTVLRVVFEGPVGETKISTFTDPHRLVIDFHRPAEPPEPGRATAGPLRTIVLDAGHGGHDSGAIGPSGLMEKELVLDVTRRVAKLVEDRLGVKVRLTRDGDQFIPLRDRTSFANRERADLFVSIHANAHRHADSEGVETYFLSSEATDNAARQVAALENSVIQLEAPANRAGGRGQDVLKAILWDLAQSEFQAESSRLAEIVLDRMTQSLRIPNRGVKQAGFYVLGGAAMPAILIEIGFVTNPREERKLKDPRYRDEIARAIVAGLAEYKRHWDQRMRAVVERPAR